MVSAVPTASLADEVENLGELVDTRSENHEAGVEYVRPSDIWNGTELVWEGEKVGQRTDWEDVRIQEDDLVELNEAENMELCQDEVEVRTTEKLQALLRVFADDIHTDDDVESLENGSTCFYPNCLGSDDANSLERRVWWIGSICVNVAQSCNQSESSWEVGV